MYVYIRNTFHNTTARIAGVRQLPYQLSEAQVRRVRRQLCGLRRCECISRVGLKVWDASGRRLQLTSDWSIKEG